MPPPGGGIEHYPEGTMVTHRFAVGQSVRFSPDRGQEQEQTKGARFKIVRLLPEVGNALQYRVKSEIGGQERVVREDQLARA
jgi:hypothetical protein